MNIEILISELSYPIDRESCLELLVHHITVLVDIPEDAGLQPGAGLRVPLAWAHVGVVLEALYINYI